MEIGEIASPGRQVLLLADFSSWKVETTDLAETDAPLLTPGMPATITLDAFPERTFRGKIEKIALVSQDNRGSVAYTVTLSFDPDDAPIRWGMTAFVKIELP
jgi:HlyD family secretion protein